MTMREVIIVTKLAVILYDFSDPLVKLGSSVVVAYSQITLPRGLTTAVADTSVKVVVAVYSACPVSSADVEMADVVVWLLWSSDVAVGLLGSVVVLTCAGVVGLAGSVVVLTALPGLVESPQIAPLALIEFPLIPQIYDKSGCATQAKHLPDQFCASRGTYAVY